MNKIKSIVVILTLVSIASFPLVLMGQGNGEMILLHGMANLETETPWTLARAGAGVAGDGSLNDIFRNPAGLVGLKGFQFQFNGHLSRRNQFENMVMMEDRVDPIILRFIDRTYQPLHSNNGVWVNDLFAGMTVDDITVDDTGLDFWHRGAGDWQEQLVSAGVSNVSLGLPVEVFGGRTIAFGLAFRNQNIYDYDRNEAYLNPVIGDWSDQGLETDGDTLDLHQFEYIRKRDGDLTMLQATVAIELLDWMNFGIGLKSVSGNTADNISWAHYGDYRWRTNGGFSFTYDDTSAALANFTESEWSSNMIDLSVQFHTPDFSAGFQFDLPTKMIRDYSDEDWFIQPDDSMFVLDSADLTMEVSMPLKTSFGIAVKPKDALEVFFDLVWNPLSESAIDMGDTSLALDGYQPWIDTFTMKLGIVYKIDEYARVAAGYQTGTREFHGWRSPFIDRGPEQDMFTAGISVDALMGTIDIGYSWQTLKYIDYFATSMHYVTQKHNRIMLGYTLKL
ncbi:MAG: hypothetical protein H8E26_07825 [FCB group bacterium]|nr:hypothetical protein [FCB group bacterium]MBL7120411.1 hypothetical protein [Candidatus Neomarinimicrobiota bacterium]